MSKIRRSVRRKYWGLLFYIITPVAFATVALAVLIVCAGPIVRKYGAIIDFVFPVVGSETQFGDIDLVVKMEDIDNLFDVFKNDEIGKGNDVEQIEYGQFSYPAIGSRFGYITVENTDIYCELYLGDGDAQLDKGAGIYYGSYIPGDNGVSLIAGHCASYFSTLGAASLGDRVYIKTNYGEYVYKIYDIRIENVAESSVYSDLQKGDNSIILYTCYPFNTLFTVSERYFVYAEYVSGPIINRG